MMKFILFLIFYLQLTLVSCYGNTKLYNSKSSKHFMAMMMTNDKNTITNGIIIGGKICIILINVMLL